MRNSSIKLLYILVATLMAGALQSCDDDYFNGGEGTKVTINATTTFSNTTSRAVFEEDTYFESGDIVITKYCFLLFGDDGAFIESFNINALPYVAELSKPVVGKNYHAFLLGNVDKETLGEITTIADLQSRTFEINRMYNLPKEEEKSKFTWSSYLPFSLSAKNLNFILNPNVAKITATITNSSSESVIKSVRVKNVVNKVGYAQNALNEYSPDYVTNVSTPTFIKYDIETFDTPIATGESKTISWYVPQNIQGDGTRKPAGDVDANETFLQGGIPDNATYVEIDGVRPSDNVTASYRVYPGIKKDGETGYADMTNFDVKADVIYNLNITINNDGIADESNITNGYKPNNESTATAKIKLPENSNCYMIHPIGDTIADVTVYELPISRVNQFWRDVEGEPGTEADDHALTADSKWQVEVIWQDINKRAIKFCDEYGVDLPDVAPGEGLNPFCFRLLNNSTDPGSQTYGNVLVGLKKLKSDGTPLEGYCWSWHLWITDYNPDKAPAHSGNAMYAKGGDIDKQGQNGAVHHYQSVYHWYWETNKESANVWDGNGIYANKWIMDRNLGAIAPHVLGIANPLDGFGMYYQYGRKDPFSYKVVYDITGKKLIHGSNNTPGPGNPQWIITTQIAKNLGEGVKNPNYVYTDPDGDTSENSDDGEVSWVKGPLNRPWYSPVKDPLQPDFGKCEKTLFDPCPAGWRIPSKYAFYFGFHNYDSDRKNYQPEGYTWVNTTPPTYYEQTDFGYAKYYAPELNTTYHPTDRWAHACVTVHVGVNGTLNSNYDFGTIFDKLDNSDNSDYISTITSYRRREIMFASLHSTQLVGGKCESIAAIFPLQGRIGSAGSTKLSSSATIGSFNDITKKSLCAPNTYNARWADFNCWLEQACLWNYEREGKSGADGPHQASLLIFQPATLDNRIYPRQEMIAGDGLFLRFHSMVFENQYLASRGQNIRCIQE
ncbi:MAG: DUF4906 domain-containing protein [Muribaculaceae bacterium]|nr:DUF4906 domain-containing protein [Muribaculaceae bacterium]